jgi:hypothetical protein
MGGRHPLTAGDRARVRRGDFGRGVGGGGQVTCPHGYLGAIGCAACNFSSNYKVEWKADEERAKNCPHGFKLLEAPYQCDACRGVKPSSYPHGRPIGDSCMVCETLRLHEPICSHSVVDGICTECGDRVEPVLSADVRQALELVRELALCTHPQLTPISKWCVACGTCFYDGAEDVPMLVRRARELLPTAPSHR